MAQSNCGDPRDTLGSYQPHWYNCVTGLSPNGASITFGYASSSRSDQRYSVPKIREVVFDNPYTIVKWTDGENTVVKCDEDDTYDREKGFLIAVAKRVFGSYSNYRMIVDSARISSKNKISEVARQVVEDWKKLDCSEPFDNEPKG